MTRKITKHIFADGLNVDGNRLDSALQDVQESINNIPLGNIKNRYVPYQLVGGFTPTKAHFLQRTMTHAGTASLISPDDPFRDQTLVTGMDGWLPATHAFSNTPFLELTTVPALTSSFYENPISVKGSLRNTEYYISGTGTRDYVLTNAFSTKEPLLIDEISCFMASNAQSPITHQVSGTIAQSPPPFWGAVTDGMSLADVQFVLTVDHEDITESVQLRTNEFMKQDFESFSGHMWQDHALSALIGVAPSSAGLPTMDTFTNDGGESIKDTNTGLYFVFRNLKISIPENSRWRLHILIPDYQISQYDKTDWTNRPDLFEISWSICCLEELRGP